MRVDLAVLGAGPAGGNAALAVAARGLAVALIEEQAAPGGQVWRAPAEGLVCAPDTDAIAGAALRHALASAPLQVLTGARTWLIGRVEDGLWRLDLVRAGKAETVLARGLMLATGAHERIVPFPGWTMPGVIGLAAATILLKAQAIMPGRRVVVAGAGPLLAVVAATIIKGGGEVAAVVDLASRLEWLATLPRLAVRPDLALRGAAWVSRILRAGVPVLSRHAVVAAEGEERLAAVTIAPVEADGTPRAEGRRRIEADALAIGHGLVPDTAATRLLRAAHRYDPACGGWHAVRDATLASDVPGLWLAGEVGGIGGVAVAELQGRLAGEAAAHALGATDAAAFAKARDTLQAKLTRAARAGAAMAWMMRPRDGLLAAIPPGTVVCRCEDVTRAELEAAMDEGAVEVNQLKQWTRCGMGPCQGRMCGEAAAGLLAARVGSREAAGMWTGRAPLRPVPMDALLGDFDYADIPIPKPAPI
jgi:NADPH-dependent 2,4-dienoyl-CoA reductase/sulfur reductase-like enzyme